METRVQPFLMFQGGAEAAINFYVSLFADGKIIEIVRYGKGAPGASGAADMADMEGSVMKAAFSIGGQTIQCIDSATKHDFSFTPAFSLWVDCQSDAEIERLFSALSEGGKTFMPMSNYGFSRRFAWFSDRFGVSWQLNLA